MGRTQIYLGSDELELLDRVSRATGASRSELVRRAVRSTYGQPPKADKLHALDQIAYIRFASVYQSFEGLEDLKREVDTLWEQKAAPPTR